MARRRMRKLNPPLLPLVSLLSITYFIYYLWWRASATINPQNPFFSWLLWGAEAFGVVSYMLFAWYTKNINPSRRFHQPDDGLKVDIFVPTYNEEEDILEATLIGCRGITYPHTTYVLDDGNRPTVKELAIRLGCKYIARPSHEHAKAGNINYALPRSSGEFIVVLDADMVPQPDYLERTLGYFKNPKLALIQIPQEFYNQDSIQHASHDTPWHEQSLFFRVIQPGKNYTNSAFWCGSPSVVRRSALQDVGGVATATVTEDIHTCVRMHSRGWQTLFVNEPLAFGIAPQTIKAFLIQRMRWAQGTMQLYRSKDCPLWIKGLTLQQRLAYFSSFLAYFESYQKLILLITPILVLGFDIFPLRADVWPFMIRWVPYFLLNIIANQIGGRGVFNYFKTEKYNLLKSIVFFQSTFTLVSRKPLKFNVTPKSVDDTVYQQERVSLRWYEILLGILLVSMCFAIIKIFLTHEQSISWSALWIAMAWAAYNSYVIFLALREIFRKRHERKLYRFPVKARGEILQKGESLSSGKIIDLSIHGAGVVMKEMTPETGNNLTLRIEHRDYQPMILPIEKIVGRSHLPSGKNSMGIIFQPELGSQRDDLFEFLYIHMPKSEERKLYRIPARILRTIIRGKIRKTEKIPVIIF
jgi:cellulose synthase (UDP-forming)